MRYYIDHEHRAYLQSFRGLVCPEFIADGGLVVQIPANTIATTGAGSAISSSVSSSLTNTFGASTANAVGAMSSAAFTSLASQAAIAKGVEKNKTAYHVKTEKDGEFMVIPDAFDDKGSIVEFKNVKYLSDSRQFRGYVAMNKPIHLILNPTSEYSEKIELMIKGSYGTIQRFDPNTKKFVIIADFTKR